MTRGRCPAGVLVKLPSEAEFGNKITGRCFEEILNESVTGGAGLTYALPDWAAVIVTVPAAPSKVTSTLGSTVAGPDIFLKLTGKL